MKDQVRWVLNIMPKSDNRQLSIVPPSNVARARFSHSTFSQYSVTPPDQLDGTAQYLGLTGLYIKNESFRFGLNAFKMLGDSFAMAEYAAEEMGRDASEMTCNYLIGETFRKESDQATFFTTTDGNRNRGVAQAVNKLGQKAVIHMPKGSSKPRYDSIAREGTIVTIEETSCDDCIRTAAVGAVQTEHGVIVQDITWEGYEEIPPWIIQGYGTVASETVEQLHQLDVSHPFHVFVQAGMDSPAGAVVGYFTNLLLNDPPKFIVMEAQTADCLYRDALAGGGTPRIVDGDFQTIMASLAYGELNTISWDTLYNHATAFVFCPDWVSARGMRMLDIPVKDDPVVISGKPGAVGMGLIAAIVETDEYKESREVTGLDCFSQMLMFFTEGNTNPMKFRKVLWDSEYSAA